MINQLPDGTINEMYPVLTDFDDDQYLVLEDDEAKTNERQPDLSAFASTKGDPDTLYLSNARKQPDWHEFEKAMNKEVNDFNEREHWELVPRNVLKTIKNYDIMKAMQTTSDWRVVEIQSTIVRARRPTNTRSNLLGHVLTSRQLVHSSLSHCVSTYTELENPTGGLCTCVSPGRNKVKRIYGSTFRFLRGSRG